MVRVVVLDRETGETFTEDIGDENPVAIYIPGTNAHGYEALTDCLFLYHVTEEYDPDDPDEHGIPWDDPRVVDLWSTKSPILSERDRGRILITGAGGQLGAALAEVFPEADAVTRADWDVSAATTRLRADALGAPRGGLDGRRRRRVGCAGGGSRVNVVGTRNVVALGAPVVYFSTDYVFDGRKGEPYVESDEPAPLSVYGADEARRASARSARAGSSASSWLFGWTSHNFVRTMLASRRRSRTRCAVVDDQRGSPTYVGHLAAAVKEVLQLPYGTYHVAAAGRVHVGGARRGDLRGGGPDLPRAADHDRGARPPGPAPGQLGPAQRARCSGAAPLARGPRACLARL